MALTLPGAAPAPVSDTELTRLFETCELGIANLGRLTGPVLLLTRFDAAGLRLRDAISGLGAVSMIVQERRLPPSWTGRHTPRLSCVLLDETYLGTAALPDMIAAIREASPSLAIVVLSGGARINLFSPAEAAPADVVLKLPASPVALKLGISAAVANRDWAEWSGRGAGDDTTDTARRGGLARRLRRLLGLAAASGGRTGGA
ncbi:hypothetical protein [Celeribacter indicus]|uniref:Uncharacterized protein n=1 Tax=Celeribacter indicus TaxID=1208324 RepID=A0A0B5DWN1_9RHOB|nr:hypothetical protein [Celeribacter indicus]AJE47828.1 hypothetical protein P73_3113 [Celeribacter indicus]SDW24206.1 hypothetical protein SAMN05443573_10299 [Celeribacter indicus]